MTGAQLYGPAVGSVPIGIGPGLFASQHGCGIEEPFNGDQPLKRCQPMIVVVRTVIGQAPIGSGFEFIGQSRGPLFPGEVPLLGELDCQSKRLCLPWLLEHGTAVVARKLGHRREVLR